LPRLTTRTRVVLLLHQLEARKPTNTGRLALRCLPNSEQVLRGRVGGEGPPDDVGPGWPEWLARAERPVLLFPHEQATPVAAWRDRPGPLTLIVPDGTWSQAVRARRRIPGLAEIPCATLPAGLVSTYRLRHDPRPGRLSTLEAIAHALGVLEDPSVAEALLQVHRLAVERTLWTRGNLTRGDVWGGIPPGARPQGMG
jgi:DTW domain-containing protein YfiP